MQIGRLFHCCISNICGLIGSMRSGVQLRHGLRFLFKLLSILLLRCRLLGNLLGILLLRCRLLLRRRNLWPANFCWAQEDWSLQVQAAIAAPIPRDRTDLRQLQQLWQPTAKITRLMPMPLLKVSASTNVAFRHSHVASSFHFIATVRIQFHSDKLLVDIKHAVACWPLGQAFRHIIPLPR